MRQRAARMICGAIAWIALVAVATFLFRSERDIDALRASQRVFDQQARETTDAIAELRAAQQAYVVGGQGVAFWVAKVVTTGDNVRANITALQKSANAPVTRSALDNAVKSLAQFLAADKRALEYINGGQPLMAGDVIFTEGGQAAAGTAQHVEAARLAERQDADARETATRRQEVLVMTGTAILIAALVMLLVLSAAKPAIEQPRVHAAPAENRVQPIAWTEDKEPVEYARRIRIHHQAQIGGSDFFPGETPILAHTTEAKTNGDSEDSGLRLGLGEFEPGSTAAVSNRAPKPDGIRLTLDTNTMDARQDPGAGPGFLKAAADLATDFGRVHDLADLRQLIARAAMLTDASGVVVWLGNTQGSDLRPVLTHGYNAQVVARLMPVPRSANNAAAAAYRSGTMQVVPSQPFSSGAIVAPILGPDGCIGALSAEFRGSESSEPVQAFAAIVAAHLAGVLAAPATDVSHNRAAS